MGGSDQFRDMLERGDVDALRRVWKLIAPHLPQLDTREGAEISMHYARTASATVRFDCRAWSHRWLTERDIPSGLPDTLKPRAERIYPRVVSAVGISVKLSIPELKPAALEIRGAMEDAVSEAYADGREDPVYVKERMQAARAKAVKALFGRSADR